MSYEAERAALETRFITAWTFTPIKWPNVVFSTSGLDEYVSMTIVGDESKQVSMGAQYNLYRYFSNVVVTIFVRPQIGSRRAFELADLASDIWRAFEFSFITIGNAHLMDMGIVNGWYQVDVIYPFYRNEYNTASVA